MRNYIEMMDVDKEKNNGIYDIHSYKKGDKKYILQLFNSVFSQTRTIEH